MKPNNKINLKKLVISISCISIIIISGINIYSSIFEQPTVKKKNPVILSNKDRFSRVFTGFIFPYNDELGKRDPSLWIKQKSDIFNRLINGNKVDILVLPLFLPKNKITVDHIERSLITRQIVENIRKNSDLKVINPDIIEYGIGENYRSLEQDQIIDIAKKYNADKVLYGNIVRKRDFADKDRDKGFVSIYFESLQKEENPDLINYTVTGDLLIENIPSNKFSSVFRSEKEYIPQILNLVGIKSDILSAITEDFSPEIIEIPVSYDALLAGIKSNKSLVPFYLQFLATIYPPDPNRYRERLYERSLISLDQLPDNNKYKALLKARALFYLNRRPEAVVLLENDTSVPAMAFKEYMNGNLNGMEMYVNKINSPLLKLLSAFEFQHLVKSYNKEDADKAIFPDEIFNDAWGLAVEYKINELDSWYLMPKIDLINTIEKQLNISNTTLNKQLILNLTQGESNLMQDYELYTIIQSQLTEALKKYDSYNTAIYEHIEPTELDRILLFHSLFEDSILRDVSYYVFTQGNLNAAAGKVENYKKILPDHPQLTALESYILYKLANKYESGQNKNNLMIESFKKSLDSIMWLRGYSGYYNMAMHSLEQILYNNRTLIQGYFPIDSNATQWENIQHVYETDYPSYYFISKIGNLHTKPHEYIHTNLFYFNTYLRKDDSEEAKKNYLLMLEDRFDGHPGKLKLLARLNNLAENKDLQAESYEKAIRAGSDNYNYYQTLGDIYISKGKYKEAFELFLSFPYFTNDKYKSKPVELSNYASSFGSSLFWRGQYEYAKKLYEISAKTGTGSDGYYQAVIRLALLEEDYYKAAEYSLRRAKRYNSPYAYRDYISLLYILGAKKEATILFEDIVDKLNSPELYLSLFVGDRINRKTDEEIIEYAKKRLTLENRTYWYAYAYMTFLTDRAANKKPQEISEIFVTDENSQNTYFGFLDGYVEARNGNYENAFEIFSGVSQLKDRNTVGCFDSHILPYYVLSALKTGNEQSVNNIRFNESQIRICNYLNTDRELMEAIKSVYVKDYKKSVDHLNNAFNLREHTSYRKLYTLYQIIEIAEILYNETGHQEYIDLVLEWARRFQVIEPMYGWLYAVVAKYSDDPEQKLESLAYALYLDPSSKWISDIPEDLKNKAREWLKNNNKFLKQKNKETDSKIAA